MDDFHDDEAHHENQDQDNDSHQKDPGQCSQVAFPAGPEHVPSNTFRMDEAPGADAIDWHSKMIADMPEGFGFNAATDRIVDLETGKSLCGPLRVAFRLCDISGQNWHCGLEFINHGGQRQEVIIDAGQIEKSMREVACLLACLGFALLGTASSLGRFIRHAVPKILGLILLQPGHARLPDGIPIYATRHGEILRTQGSHGLLIRTKECKALQSVAGTLQTWQIEVASLAMGNPALILALATALSGPLLAYTNAASIGLNLYSLNSSGKSTALKMMGSAYEDSSVLNNWRATPTAVELMAAEANDGLLILDEFPSEPERWHVETVMMIGNGTGKSRSNVTLALNRAKRSRVVIASTAEESMRHYMTAAGLNPPDGLSVRMIDIPVRRWTHGVFEDLHGYSGGGSFSKAICDAVARNHGTAGPAFIRWILKHDTELRAEIGALIACAFDEIAQGLGLAVVPDDVGRVLTAFSLISVAGELAIRAGILPWKAGTSRAAVVDVAKIWLAGRNGEVSQRCRRIAEGIHAKRDAFVDLAAPGTSAQTETGWKTKDWFYVLPAAFDAFAGEHPQNAARDLEGDGLLQRGTEANCLLSRISIPGLKERKRVYSLKASAILAALGPSED
ncbi:DUF927 domain-containing protein [Rhodobacter sp. KR11]|uniref:DUF927 domain-containing protein n=1 Tax=Rhodobacter sp. KR11 TaxID=2974588 RepID=UPI0022214555|nr:DUF927 domain-containing protein [Rhodobacter sp. KR11]MCW1918055.1 DUF927 domain-containing protein [Rhodobacter sp. KR11]